MGRVRHAVAGITLIASLAVAASAAADQVVSVETKGGFGASKFTGDAPGAENKQGFSGAIGVYRTLSSWLSVGAEVGYAMKGTSFGTVTDPTFGSTTYIGTFEYLYAADYVEVPVLFRAHMGGNIRPVVFGGPVLGWKVLEKVRLHSAADGDYEGEGVSLKALDFAAAGGLGLEIGPTDRCLTLDARYTASLADNLKDEFSGSIKNTDFRVMIGWRTTWKPGFGTL